MFLREIDVRVLFGYLKCPTTKTHWPQQRRLGIDPGLGRDETRRHKKGVDSFDSVLRCHILSRLENTLSELTQMFREFPVEIKIWRKDSNPNMTVDYEASLYLSKLAKLIIWRAAIP